MLRVLSHVAVLIPVRARASIHQFDKANLSFSETAGDQTLPAEPVVLAALHPVEGKRLITLFGEIEDFLRLGLHMKRRLKSPDPRREVAVVPAHSQMLPIEC